MFIKNGFLIMGILGVLSTQSLSAGTPSSHKNIYVTSTIDKHIPEFVAMEISNDFKASIAEYNQNRRQPKFFIPQLKSTGLSKIFAKLTKNIILPELKPKAGTAFFSMTAGKDRIEIDPSFFLTKKYILNGIEKTISSEDFSTLEERPIRNRLTQLFSALLTSAMADDEEEDPNFKLSYNNLKTTKILLLSLIALDSSFKNRSLMDKVPLVGGGENNTNIKKLKDKIDLYQTQCEESLNTQEDMLKASNTDFFYMHNYMSQNDRDLTLTKLQAISDPSYQATFKIILQMTKENNRYPKKKDEKLAEVLNVDLSATQCEALLRPSVKMSKGNRLANYVDGGNNENINFINHPCTKIAKLKLCLSQFTTQEESINNFAREYPAEAKKAGVPIYNIPRGFPLENTGK